MGPPGPTGLGRVVGLKGRRRAMSTPAAGESRHRGDDQVRGTSWLAWTLRNKGGRRVRGALYIISDRGNITCIIAREPLYISSRE